MTPRANRLRKKKDIDRVFTAGRNFREDRLVLKTADNGLKTVRFCFIVSHKVSKNAVGRNKIKRRLREIARSFLPRIADGRDIVMIASPGLAERDFWEIKACLGKLFTRAKLFKQ